MTDPAGTPPAGAARARAALVAAAAQRWAAGLGEPGDTDPLLHFRALTVGTLDLARAAAEPRTALMGGAPTPVTRLFPHEPQRGSALRSVRAIRNRAREASEERGLHVGHLALGLASWDDAKGRRPAAPVLLRRVDVWAGDAAETDFVVRVADDLEVNPVLLHYLATELGVRLAPEDLLDPHGRLGYAHVVDRLREFAPAHIADGFAIAHRAVLGTFDTATPAVVADLHAAPGLLAGSDIVATLAGDPAAGSAERPPAVPPSAGDDGDPSAERDLSADRLVLDADTVQQAVVDDALAGRDVVVQAAPGTGATQTIANLVAGLAARGETVLVVAEKRAALGAVLGRLEQVGLADLALDLRDGSGDGGAATRALAETLAMATAEPPAADGDGGDAAGAVGDVVARREVLADHVRALHGPREPWGLSVYDAEVVLAGTPAAARTGVRLEPGLLRALDPAARQRRRDLLRDYAELGGLSPAPADSAWVGAAVDTPDDAARAGAALRRLRGGSLPAVRDSMTRATVEVGLAAPRDVAGTAEAAGRLAAVRDTLALLRPGVWDAPIDDLVAATATRRWRRGRGIRQGWLDRRRLRRHARDLRVDRRRGPAGERLHSLLALAAEQRSDWRARSRDGRQPRTGPTLDAALAAHAAFMDDLAALAGALPAARLADATLADLAARLDRLAMEEPVLTRMPRLRELARLLAADGLGALVGELRAGDADAPTALAAFDAAFAGSFLADVRRADPRIGGFDGAAHDRAVQAYREADLRHLARSADRVRAAHAAHVRAVGEAHPEQAALVAAAGGDPGRDQPIHALVRAAPDVVLAARPCWVMSPAAVSRLLPAERLFDVVVVEGAGRLSVGDAVPALARGRRVAAFGDDRQLPPPGAAESLLGTLATFVPTRTLPHHYGSSDERLIALSNAAVYSGGLATLPGPGGGECLRLVRTGDGDDVQRVVELVLRHARTHPHESLGVVALHRPHAERIDGALRQALAHAGDVAAYFGADPADDAAERFFVKPVELAQGDRRDAVVLSLGYARPAEAACDERRLNVAITRARRRLTVVSSFAEADVDPEWVRSSGAWLLRDVLAYAAAAGDLPVAGRPGAAPPDALERALAGRLRAAGLPVVVTYGVWGRVDLALAHPDDPRRMMLAVETDGPTYRDGGPTRERDRRRPERLERLGWTHLRVWTLDWASDPDRVVERVRATWERAVADAAARPGVAVEAGAAT